MSDPSSPAHGAPGSLDVHSLHGRRNDERWNRVAVGDVLERLARSEPERTAILAAPDAVADPRYARVSFAEANRTADRMANVLLGLGLGRGERVAMLCENSVEAYLTKMAVAKAGLVVVPVNPVMADDMIDHVLRLTEVRVAVVDADLWRARGALFTGAGVAPVVVVRGGVPGPPGVPEFHDAVSAAPSTEPDVRIHGDDVWEILPTSGTTSMPKAVMISHTYSYHAATAHALSYSRGVDRESDLRICTFLPVIYHIGHHAFVLAAFLAGGSVVLGRRPTAAATAESLTRDGATCLWGGSPQFLADLAREVEAHPDTYDLRGVEVIVYGWSAIPPELADRLTELCSPRPAGAAGGRPPRGRLQLVGIFGQTEAIACHRFWPTRWAELHRRTAPGTNYVGVPTALLGSTVVDAEGASLHERPGEAGEAVYRSPAMFSGYYRDPEATAAALRGGWFHSGDMCAFGEDGLRVMVDRYKDVVKSGGENVSSVRVEAVLADHPAVGRVAVIGVPDEKWGELVTAVVVPAPGQAVGEAELVAWARARLAGYETPKRVVFATELPETVGGKIRKAELRSRLT